MDSYKLLIPPVKSLEREIKLAYVDNYYQHIMLIMVDGDMGIFILLQLLLENADIFS